MRRKKKISLLRLQLRLDCNVEDVCIHIKLNSIKKFFMPESKHSPVFLCACRAHVQAWHPGMLYFRKN